MRVYAVLDAARDEQIFDAVDACREDKSCLYAGRIPFALQRVAPYLVELSRDAPFTQSLVERGWGNSWGIFLRSDRGMMEVRRHLRHFLRVKDESGRRLLFRWYDPRVLRIYLPTCYPEEVRTFFGPIEMFAMEAQEPGALLQFSVIGGALYSARRELARAQRS
jgi:hypothetical protein